LRIKGAGYTRAVIKVLYEKSRVQPSTVEGDDRGDLYDRRGRAKGYWGFTEKIRTPTLGPSGVTHQRAESSLERSSVRALQAPSTLTASVPYKTGGVEFIILKVTKRGRRKGRQCIPSGIKRGVWGKRGKNLIDKRWGIAPTRKKKAQTGTTVPSEGVSRLQGLLIEILPHSREPSLTGGPSVLPQWWLCKCSC